MKSLFKQLTCLAAFAVTQLAPAQTAGDYRSVANGAWTDLPVWQKYDGANWNAATTVPASADGVITIATGTMVTNTASRNVDQIVVQAGATLVTTNGTLTVAHGTGTDLDVFGTVLINGGSGSLTLAPSAVVNVESGGVIVHNGTSNTGFTAGAGSVMTFLSGGRFSLVKVGGTIPTVTWNQGSICEVAYVGDGAKPATAALVQNFGDFVINCPAVATGWDFAGNLNNHVGKFTVTLGANPGVTEVKLFSGSSSTGNLNVGGDFTINSGSVNVASSGGPWSLTVASNLTVAAGADLNLSGSSSAAYTMILNGTGPQTYTCNGTNRAQKLSWTVNNGSTLNLNSDLALTAAGRTLTANGTLNLNGKTITTDLLAGTGTIRNQGGGTGTLIFGVGNSTNTIDNTITLQDGASGTLGLVKGGNSGSSGLLTITAPQTFSGGLIISNGITLINNTTGSGSGSGGISVLNGTLGGTGAVTGPVTFTAGTLSPGVGGIGTFTVNGTLNLAGNTSIDVIKGTGRDQVTATTVNYAGTLTIVTNGNTFVTTDTFQIFNAGSHSGNFTSIVGSPGAGMAWSFDPATGILSVVNATVAQPTLNITPTGNSRQFSWTGSFKLQAQTNNSSAGLNNNWSDYPGGGVSGVTVTIDPANPAVFFRLISVP